MKKILWIVVAAVVVAGCGAPKSLTTPKTNAETLASAGDYVQATGVWKNYFDETEVEDIAGADFATAAKTAFKAGNTELAKSWFDQARYKDYSDAEMYVTLAKIYKADDNLSKELSALEYYTENFGDGNSDVNARLFEIYAEIDMNDKALQAWAKMDEAAKSTEKNLGGFLVINKKLENNAVCDSVSLALLELNPEHIGALEWNAKKYYWAGQNRYDREMEKYNKNKTTRQYRILLKELDLVTADFKKALPYLDKLWKLQPGKEYAGYLANIYARFGDEQKTDYYKKYLK